VIYRCPKCRVHLTAEDSIALRCTRCLVPYPLENGVVDFSGGQYYDAFDPQQELSAEHLRGLEAEVSGARWRIEKYYGPRLPARARVLDCGCGNGVSVDALMAQRFDAWGIDLSSLRKWQWRERIHRERLGVASALRLPFGDATFDVVLSSGVIEHIGVAEEGGDTYRVRPLPDRDEQRAAFVSELLRVTRRGGSIFIDCPNGGFPIDFWHNSVGGRARFHRRDEGFLPTFREIEKLAGGHTVVAHSPHRRFAFRQVGRHWYGKIFALPMRVLFALMGERIATSAMNPYLVVEVKKR
jgi:SAM-dependent methyltransferase